MPPATAQKASARPLGGDTASFGQQLLALQQRMWRHNERKVAELVAPPGKALAAYTRRYRRAVAQARGPSTWPALVRAAQKSHVTFVGDYHPLPAARLQMLRLVQALCAQKPGPLTLALEFFRATDQPILDAFAAGKLSLATLKRQTCHPGRHVPGTASWDSFVPLLTWARAEGCTLLGIDSRGQGPGGLHRRDARAAKILAQALAAAPTRRMVVLAGQMHVVPKHLPAAVQALAQRPLRLCVIYQNPEKLWFRALGEGRNARPAQVLRIDANSFALMHTSPITAQLAYLAQLTEMGESEGFCTPQQAFATAARQVAQFFGLQVPHDLASVQVHTADDLSFLRPLAKKLTPAGFAHLRRQLSRGESAFVPQANLVFLASLAPGVVGEEATHYLRFCCQGRRLPHQPQQAVELFYRHAFEEALGFVGARVLHPERPAPSRPVLRRLAAQGAGQEKRIAQAALAHLAMQAGQVPRRPADLFPNSTEELDAVAHLTGYHLGEALFCALLARKVSKAEVARLFARSDASATTALANYLSVLAWLQPRQGR